MPCEFPPASVKFCCSGFLLNGTSSGPNLPYFFFCLRQANGAGQARNDPPPQGKNRRSAASRSARRDGAKETLRVPAQTRNFERLGPMGKASLEHLRVTAFPRA